MYKRQVVDDGGADGEAVFYHGGGGGELAGLLEVRHQGGGLFVGEISDVKADDVEGGGGGEF